jgi:hypothetical protein
MSSQKIVELYYCDSVPSLVPEFVDPHITVDEQRGKEVYLIEVDPNHPDALKVRDSGKTIKQVLGSMGFVKATHYYTGERPF